MAIKPTPNTFAAVAGELQAVGRQTVRSTSGPSGLFGQWRLLRSEDETMDKNVMMEFMEDGRLTYTVDLGHKRQIMNLTFQVDGDRIVTDQPSSPRFDQTRFWFETPDRLVLQHDARSSWFQRT